MQAQDLLWRIQHVHERIVHTLAMVDKSVAAQPANSSPALQGLQTPERGSRVHSVAPGTPSILSTLARARRSLHLHLMEERKLLREYALAVGVQEKLLPPAFDRTCRFVASTPIQPSAHMEHFSTTPQKTQPTAALPDADSFDVRFMLQLRQTLIGQLAPLLRQPVSIGEELVVQHVLRTEDFHRAQVLLSDITKYAVVCP